MNMKIQAKSDELWDFIVFLYHMKEYILQEIDEKKEKLVFCHRRLTENQFLIEEKIIIEKRSFEEHGIDNDGLLNLQKSLKKIEHQLEELEVYTIGGLLERKKAKIVKAINIAAKNLEKYVEYLEDLDFDSSYKEYCVHYAVTEKKQYRKIRFRGITFWVNEDNFDLDEKDAYGNTNLERMLKGKSPIGKDGMYINLHHMIQSECLL